jgi:serine/threonine-protein kinase HipA
MTECEAFGLSPAEAAAEVMRVIEVVSDWKAHFSAQGVSQRDIHSLAQQIDGDYLLSQRTGFSPEQFDIPAFKKPRKAPFK